MTNTRKLTPTKTTKRSPSSGKAPSRSETKENYSELRRGLREIRRTGHMPESVRRGTSSES